MEDWTKQLARFCSRLDYGTLPQEVMEKTKWIVLDSLGNIFGAATLEFGRTMAEYAQSLGDRKEATVLGFGFRSSARHAGQRGGTKISCLFFWRRSGPMPPWGRSATFCGVSMARTKRSTHSNREEILSWSGRSEY